MTESNLPAGENIQVKDGKLVINPVKKVTETENKDAGNLLKNSDFSEGMEGWNGPWALMSLLALMALASMSCFIT